MALEELKFVVLGSPLTITTHKEWATYQVIPHSPQVKERLNLNDLGAFLLWHHLINNPSLGVMRLTRPDASFYLTTQHFLNYVGVTTSSPLQDYQPRPHSLKFHIQLQSGSEKEIESRYI